MNGLSALLSLGALGLIFGLSLGVAAKKFAVERDPRVDEILAVLPGANCGACG
ncbi:MAG TPA: electron transporter RnfB, partial [Firmicutes bacterium]|nr:electron transporter RnfB [Bacillota bacterium]